MKQLEFNFMKDLLTPEELILQLMGEQSTKEFDYWVIKLIVNL